MGLPEAERVYFASAFEALARVLIARRPELMDEVAKLKVDLRELQSAYPASLWRDSTSLVAQRLFPELSPPVAEYRLGQLITQEYENTMVGKALIAMLRILGPQRVATRVSRSFRASNNYTEDKVTVFSATDYELWTNELHVPYVHQGVIQSALEAIGARHCVVDVVRRDQDGTTYRCRWEA